MSDLDTGLAIWIAAVYSCNAGEEEANNSATTLFEDIYNLIQFRQSMAKADVQVLSSTQALPASQYHRVDVTELSDLVKDLQSYRSVQHLEIGCPLWKVPAEIVLQHTGLVRAVLAGLQPSQDLLHHVEAAVWYLQGLSADGAFNFLHLRKENVWIAHCRIWESLEDSIVRNNCFNNTFSLASQLAIKGIQPEVPFVTANWGATDMQLAEQALTSLVHAGYNIISHPDALQPVHALPPGVAAAVSFCGMKSNLYIGNSVSIFSAVSILERRLQGNWASYYNGGDIPLAGPLPLYPLPWVFTYNFWSRRYNYMLKPEVLSARAHASLQPVCLYSGNTSSSIYKWLTSHGVHIIVRDPSWAAVLENQLNNSNENRRHSHLYSDPKMAVGAWQRIDVPVLPYLSEHEHVLFTDSDVYFTKPLTLHSFELSLPTTIGMAPEAVETFPFNSGVMLMNLPALKATYASFLKFVFSNDHGMYFPNYGPALGQWIRGPITSSMSIRCAMLPKVFNAKPYHEVDSKAAVVHWHGLKPAHVHEDRTLPSFYRRLLQKRSCWCVLPIHARVDRVCRLSGIGYLQEGIGKVS